VAIYYLTTLQLKTSNSDEKKISYERQRSPNREGRNKHQEFVSFSEQNFF